MGDGGEEHEGLGDDRDFLAEVRDFDIEVEDLGRDLEVTVGFDGEDGAIDFEIWEGKEVIMEGEGAFCVGEGEFCEFEEGDSEYRGEEAEELEFAEVSVFNGEGAIGIEGGEIAEYA